MTKQDYTEAAIQSLKVQFNLASTDFGTSRQRDLGQKWSDTIRGYLGEIALRKYFQEKYNIDIALDHEKGNFEEYINTDIYFVKKQDDTEYRKSKLNISIKTTKANGIWLDIPGQQFTHSDVFILIKLGIGTDHLFSFFKEISVFKDKILLEGQNSNLISQEEANQIYEQVTNFEPITAYIPGYILAKNYQNQLFTYVGKKGKKNHTIIDYAGEYKLENLQTIKHKENLDHSGKVEFESIGKFTQQDRYIFGLQTLEKNNNWQKDIIDKI